MENAKIPSPFGDNPFAEPEDVTSDTTTTTTTKASDSDSKVTALKAKSSSAKASTKFKTQSAPVKPKFRTMQPGAVAVNLPEAGTYPGELTKLKILDGDHDLRAVVDITVFDSDGVAHEADATWIVLFAEPPSEHAKTSRLREGGHWLKMLHEATGVTTYGADPWEMASDLEGRQIAVRVSRSTRNGVPGLRVNSIMKAIS